MGILGDCSSRNIHSKIARRNAELEALRQENARLRRDNKQLRDRALRDPLTGLWTRCAFDQRLSYEWTRACRSWTPLSIVVLAVDDMFLLRHALGHVASERLLKQLGTWLPQMCREVDVACRIGELELALIMPETNRTAAEVEMKRLDEAFRRWLSSSTLLSAGVELTLSFGMAMAFADAQTPMELVMVADEARLLDRSAQLGEPTDSATDPCGHSFCPGETIRPPAGF